MSTWWLRRFMCRLCRHKVIPGIVFYQVMDRIIISGRNNAIEWVREVMSTRNTMPHQLYSRLRLGVFGECNMLPTFFEVESLFLGNLAAISWWMCRAAGTWHCLKKKFVTLKSLRFLNTHFTSKSRNKHAVNSLTDVFFARYCPSQVPILLSADIRLSPYWDKASF